MAMSGKLAMLAAATILPIAAQAQMRPTKPLAVPIKPAPAQPRSMPLPRPNASPAKAPMLVKFLAPVRIERPGKLPAAQIRQSVLANNVRVKNRKLKMIMVPMTVPGIGRLNGETGGTLEPGGDYEIAGNGFGTAGGVVLLRHPANRTVQLGVTLWTDKLIYVHMPDDISGLADAPAELVVAPPGKAPFKSRAFSFYAAREDIDLPIANDMFAHDGSESPGIRPHLSFDGKFFVVSRSITDTDRKNCFDPGRDRISWGGRLANGFQVTAYYFARMDFSHYDEGGVSQTPRGAFAFNWEGDSIAVNYGVMRYYSTKFVAVGGDGSCASSYQINLVATGPRGLRPM